MILLGRAIPPAMGTIMTYAEIDAIESDIMYGIAKSAIQRGFSISVADEEECIVACSRCVPDIMAAAGMTELTVFSIRDKGNAVGKVVFVHGNGMDVIHDHSDNAVTNAIVNPVVAKIEARLLAEEAL